MKLNYDSEGRSNKEVFLLMAKQFRDAVALAGPEQVFNNQQVVLITTDYAEQLAQFFEDIANAIEDE